nr:hypothetical protein [Tanacetum cinerariifolium]
MGSPATHLDDGFIKSKSLPKGTLTDLKYSRSSVQLSDKGFPFTTGSDQSGSGINVQLSDKGFPFTTSSDQSGSGIKYQDLDDELKELSDEKMLEAGDEMYDAFPLHTDETSQPSLSTEQVIPTEE